jgi:hypothetical protein
MNEDKRIAEARQAACGAGIFHAIFRLTAISDLYGPETAVEWAESLLDDPKLLMAFARSPDNTAAEVLVTRLRSSAPTESHRPVGFPDWN